jgi:hypothetical protein
MPTPFSRGKVQTFKNVIFPISHLAGRHGRRRTGEAQTAALDSVAESRKELRSPAILPSAVGWLTCGPHEARKHAVHWNEAPASESL